MNDLLSKIEKCSKCKSDPKIADYIIESKPNSFVGSKHPTILLIGHSPAVRTNEPATIVLKLNKENQPLYKYIHSKILLPLNIALSSVYATNLIKCQTKKLPEDMDINLDFFEKSFAYCKDLLEEEIEVINPDLIISLSERVLKILSKNYMCHELCMKESFATLQHIKFKEKIYKYIPLVHIPKGDNSPVAKHYIPQQTERLEKLRYVIQ